MAASCVVLADPADNESPIFQERDSWSLVVGPIVCDQQRVRIGRCVGIEYARVNASAVFRIIVPSHDESTIGQTRNGGADVFT